MPNQVVPATIADVGALKLLESRITNLAGATLHLYKNDLVPNQNSVLADFVANEADFTGYAAATLTWSAAGVDGEGNYVSLSNRAYFAATDAVKPNIVAGAWLQDGAATPALIEFFAFDPQLDFSSALKFAGAVVNLTGKQLDVALVDF